MRARNLRVLLGEEGGEEEGGEACEEGGEAEVGGVARGEGGCSAAVEVREVRRQIGEWRAARSAAHYVKVRRNPMCRRPQP